MENTRTAFTDSSGDTLELITGFIDELILFKAITANESNNILVELDPAATKHLVKLLTIHLDSLNEDNEDTTKIRKVY